MVTRYEYFDSRNNRWNPYDAATCAFLESAEQANPNAIVQLQGLPFQVRFGQNARSQKMVSSTGILQVNVNTENSRDVRRVAPMQPQQQQMVQVQVPPNAYPGMHVQARIPDGRTINVPIPAGVMPGQIISVAVPAPAPTSVSSEAIPVAEAYQAERVSGPPPNAEPCVICQEAIRGAHERLPCAHVFHRACLERWLRDREHRFCPICKTPV